MATRVTYGCPALFGYFSVLFQVVTLLLIKRGISVTFLNIMVIPWFVGSHLVWYVSCGAMFDRNMDRSKFHVQSQ